MLHSDSHVTFVRNMLVRISAGTPASLMEVIRVIPQNHQADVGIVSRLGHDRFLQNPFQFVNRPTIRHCTI
jgi:hypothetical protein